MMKKQNDFISFNDGIVGIYNVQNVAEMGDAIKEQLVLYNNYRYNAKTVGMQRYFLAMQNNVNITAVIRIPTLDKAISTQNIAVINDVQYTIQQVQIIKADKPYHLQLTLSELEEKYDFKRV